jgi:hypothetical protein
MSPAVSLHFDAARNDAAEAMSRKLDASHKPCGRGAFQHPFQARKMAEKGRIVFFAHFRSESDDRGILDSPAAVTGNAATADGYRKSLLGLNRHARFGSIATAVEFQVAAQHSKADSKRDGASICWVSSKILLRSWSALEPLRNDVRA